MLTEFSRNPALINIAPGADISMRIRMFLGHYDLRVYVSDTAYIDVGRGSFNAAQRVHYVIPDFAGCIGTVGQFCEFATGCKLLGGGEHHNDLPVNITLTGVPAFVAMATKHGIKSVRPKDQEPFHIGNAVVVSADAKVMPGATIGDGTVLAADALASGDAESFSVYGGLPARKLKDRVDDDQKAKLGAVRWWDFDLVYLGNNLDRLQELSVDTKAKHVYRQPAPRFILKMVNFGTPQMQVQIIGFLKDGQQYKFSDAPAKVIDYVKQISSDGPKEWVADIWEA